MRFTSLEVSNFRAISNVALHDLGDCVVLAGPNGCGKSCVLDAIRLLKSACGGYKQNEWQSWFGEFQIAFNQRQDDVLKLLQDRSKPLRIAAEFALHQDEIDYLRENAELLLTNRAWEEIAPDAYGWRHRGMIPLAANLRGHEKEIHEYKSKSLPTFLSELESGLIRVEVTVSASGDVQATDSKVLQIIFSTYEPQRLGIIDYHGAHRHYNREQLGGINLAIESADQQLRQHALYDYSNKYANLKQEMATSYVRYLLAKEAGATADRDDRLTSTLKELFTTFFPGKVFLGPQPSPEGSIHFRVQTATGALHDIDELSSGEKEVLYGYLRMRNSAPRHSVLLIDEPELHLNPRLVSGLASFYRRHLAQENSNQIWLVTHSDTLIREAVGQDGYKVFHMQAAGVPSVKNQTTELTGDDQVESAIIELVGDLAAYRPGAKVVLFEGGGDTEFDVHMTCTLFPRFHAAVNVLSGGNKRRVRDLHAVLEDARKLHAVPGMFFSIADRDADDIETDATGRRLTWDAYHIENYLLEPRYLVRAMQDINLAGESIDEMAVSESLNECARSVLTQVVSARMHAWANAHLVRCLDVRFDRTAEQVAANLAAAIDRSCNRIRETVGNSLSKRELEKKVSRLVADCEADLANGAWRVNFPGRLVLRKFASQLSGIKYERFRDIIIARMRDDKYEPPGMRTIVDQILNASWR